MRNAAIVTAARTAASLSPVSDSGPGGVFGVLGSDVAVLVSSQSSTASVVFGGFSCVDGCRASSWRLCLSCFSMAERSRMAAEFRIGSGVVQL